jgi:hypothetical protein
LRSPGLGIHARMDDQRYRELIEKRDSTGLSLEETEELGKLMAEREGKEYEGSAENPPEDVELRRASVPEEEIEERVDSKTYRDVDDSVMTREGQPSRDKDFPPPA